ncbi:unnamed protein product [Blepharisma stoltei]|uniref:Uncharacterized protein n=1 Tax=Blepharisma stoltei TaxID=1481888 RepID=A0AAU9JEY6_9CILI|nr:unnamed protein product [Blepharisma stoltei]
MDIERIKEKLELREQQLRIMAEQLSEHLATLATNDQKIQELDERFNFLEKEAKKKQEMLNQELANKEILLSQLHSLESLFEGSVAKKEKQVLKPKINEEFKTTSNFVEFYSKIQFQPQVNSFKNFPQFPDSFDTKGIDLGLVKSISSGKIDIKTELKKMGIEI